MNAATILSSLPKCNLPAAQRLTAGGARCRVIALAALGVLPAAWLHADSAYTEDFASGTASGNWSGVNLPVSQAGGTNTSWYLGQLNNDAVTLALTGLDLAGGNATPNSQGQHAFVTVSYDLFVIGEWIGNNGSTAETAHTFAFGTTTDADGHIPRLTTTFSNLPGQYQTFPYESANDNYFAQPGGKGANQINTLGFSGATSGYDDAVYQMAGGRNQSFTFDHGSDDLILDFSAANLPAGATWGLTNVKVATGGVFNWQAAPVIGDGLDGGWEVGEHWANPDFTMNQSPGPDDLAQFTAAGTYNVSIHQPTSAGFLHLAASTADASTINFNTIGHPLTLTAGNYSNVSLAVADGSNQSDTLFVFNSYNDEDSDFNGVINAETVGVARGVGAQGTLTLDGYLDPAKPGTNDNPLGNVILNVQREMSIGDARYHDDAGNVGVATLNILHGAILNSGLGGGSASSNPGDDNATGTWTYVDGTVNVDDQGIWNQTAACWIGVFGTGSLNVTNGSHVNIFQPPYAGQAAATTGSLSLGGFAGSSATATVKDPDSQINAGFIQVGTTGIDALLAIDNSGVVNGTYVSIGSYTNGTTGPSGNAEVKVTHQGLLNVGTATGDGQLNVGDYFDGKMTLGDVFDGNVPNAGLATADIAIIGNAAGVTGEVDVSYAQEAALHSLFTVNKTLTVAAAGNASLHMNGGGVTVLLGQGAGSDPIGIVGEQAGSNGLITLFGGAGSDTWAQPSTIDASAGGVVLGKAGFGRLEVYDNAQSLAKTVLMAQLAGSSAELMIDGNGADHVHTTFLKVSDPDVGLAVGQAGDSATADVLNGGLLDTFRATVGGQGDNLATGTVRVQDLRDPAMVTNHETGSLWLVHGQSLGVSSTGGTLDIGGEGLGGQHGGSGGVTLGAGGRLGVDIALQLGSNGRLDITGGSATVGTTDPLLMDATPNRLHVVGNTTLPEASATVYGMGVITADVLVHGGGNLGPNGSTGSETGTLSIVGSLHEFSGGNIATHISAASPGFHDAFALRDALLTAPAGTATLSNGAGVTLIGQGSYHNPQVGDFIDVVTAAKVIIGTLNLTFQNLPATDWHYGVVSIPGGQALRIQYGAAVHEPGSVTLSGTVLINGTPAGDVLVAAAPGFSALTDASGQYALAVPTNSSGTLAPSEIGFLSTPSLRTFTNLTSNLSGQDFLMSGTLAPAVAITAEGPLRRVSWTGIEGATYQEQTSVNLVDWTNLNGPVTGTNGPLSFTFQTSPDPQRFFRVRAEK